MFAPQQISASRLVFDGMLLSEKFGSRNPFCSEIVTMPRSKCGLFCFWKNSPSYIDRGVASGNILRLESAVATKVFRAWGSHASCGSLSITYPDPDV